MGLVQPNMSKYIHAIVANLSASSACREAWLMNSCANLQFCVAFHTVRLVLFPELGRVMLFGNGKVLY